MTRGESFRNMVVRIAEFSDKGKCNTLCTKTMDRRFGGTNAKRPAPNQETVPLRLRVRARGVCHATSKGRYTVPPCIFIFPLGTSCLPSSGGCFSLWFWLLFTNMISLSNFPNNIRCESTKRVVLGNSTEKRPCISSQDHRPCEFTKRIAERVFQDNVPTKCSTLVFQNDCAK